VPPRDQPPELQFDPAPIWPEDDPRLEPAFLAGPLWIEFAEADRLSLEPAHASLQAALLVGFDEPDQADLERAQQRAEEPPPPPPQRAAAIGIAGSFGVHLLPLVFLLLLGWSAVPGELAAAIPVQLVIEAPPPERPAPEPSPPTPTRLASEDIGDAAKTEPPSAEPRPALSRPAQPRLAGLVPPPPKATAPPKAAIAPPPMPRPAPAPAPQAPSRPGRIPGPEATRDEYLSYLVTLTRRHVDLLPMAVIGDRRGETTLSLVVLGDGTIARIAIVQGSGYHDIDTRIEQIVAAVRRFPPLPQRFPDSTLELTLRFRFPDAVLGR
jgi:TonB family protein